MKDQWHTECRQVGAAFIKEKGFAGGCVPWEKQSKGLGPAPLPLETGGLEEPSFFWQKEDSED